MTKLKWVFLACLVCFVAILIMASWTTQFSVGHFISRDFRLTSAGRRHVAVNSHGGPSVHWIEWTDRGHKWFSHKYRFGRHKNNSHHGDEKFQPINDHRAWVYSAYFDPANQTNYTIKVFGIANFSDDHPVQCHLEENGSRTVVNGTRERMPDGHNSGFWAACFMCFFGNSSHPDVVSLTFNVSERPTNRLAVTYPQPREWDRDFTVCYAALHDYQHPSRFIQSIEINRVLGAQHFFVYNYSVSNTTDAVLRHYQRLGLLTVLPWPLPTLDVWYYGQNLAINDCVYRNKFVSQFVVIQDTDEFIVPTRQSSWGDVIKLVESDRNATKNSSTQKTTGFFSSYSFESTLCNGTPQKTKWEALKKNFSISSEEEQFIINNSLIPFLHLQRMNWTFKYNVRSKTIVRPESVIFSGIHYTHAHRDSAAVAVVSSDVAFVQHFYKNISDSNILDTSLLRFIHTVLANLRSVIETLSLGQTS